MKKDFVSSYDYKLQIPSQISKFLEKSEGRLNEPHRQSLPQANIYLSHITKTPFPKPFVAQQNQKFAPPKYNENRNKQFPQKPNFHKNKYQQQQIPLLPHDNKQLICYYCERFSHSTMECPFNPYCRHCNQFHQKGTTNRCKNTRWDPQDKTIPRREAVITNYIKNAIYNNNWE